MIHEEYPTDVLYTPDAKPDFALLQQMYVERGTKADWDALHHLHYKSEGKPVGAHYYRLVLNDQTIGVTALTLPRPLLKERHVAFPKFKPGHDSKAANTARYQLINANIRVIGRIVLDTMYRGVGASYRFQNLVSRMSGYKIIEIQSAMSKYNLFAQKAGFRFVKPMRSNKYEVGLRFFRETFETHPADTAGILEELNRMPPALRATRIAAIRKFYYAHSALEKTGSARETGAARVEGLPVEELVRQLQQLILGSPLYGVYLNPDVGRSDIPARLYLPQFDKQATNERMNLT
ncbi:MAG: hypothetical protein LPK02_06965 [Rhodobacterales bacterium]|nr:hypothetical protein [Rhodobacterales bacterium]